MTKAPHPPLLERDLDEVLLPARGEKVALTPTLNLSEAKGKRKGKGRMRGNS